MRKFNVAIDGWSSCGKSTLAKELARKLHFVYVDSGAMYRTITLYALRHSMITDGKVNVDQLVAHLGNIKITFLFNRSKGFSDTFLNGENVEEEIREMAVSSHVSEVSRIREVREKLRALQQSLGKGKGVVMDGRDIGTAIFPGAELKFFMTASKEVRARRRYEELLRKNRNVTLKEVAENLKQRDRIDSTRKESPLRQPHDAIVIDNTFLTHEEQLNLAMRYAISRIGIEKED